MLSALNFIVNWSISSRSDQFCPLLYVRWQHFVIFISKDFKQTKLWLSFHKKPIVSWAHERKKVRRVQIVNYLNGVIPFREVACKRSIWVSREGFTCRSSLRNQILNVIKNAILAMLCQNRKSPSHALSKYETAVRKILLNWELRSRIYNRNLNMSFAPWQYFAQAVCRVLHLSACV